MGPFEIIYMDFDHSFRVFDFQKTNSIPYFLVTHLSYMTAPGLHEKILSDPNLIRWYAKNANSSSHPKLVPLPIGLYEDTPEHHSRIVRASLSQKKFEDRPIDLYVNVALESHKSRSKNFEFCNSTSFTTLCRMERIPFDEYLEELGNSKFVLSPRGAGFDCFRTWEAIIMGAIPIIERSPIDALYQNERILLVDSFDEITASLLQETEEKFESHEFGRSKVFKSYWKDMFHDPVREVVGKRAYLQKFYRPA
ncbi:unnamed protein product [Caenorhabditis auriculariae]|uniref:RXYLT1 C-terminal domain-containing protein n=1 Tax=Caenorhabditis auriculariae TaxID=2777116 RepID=A0A8S1HCG1_9PELO|nr:unnamed protein product [Caenorhabditis auriculariae]